MSFANLRPTNAGTETVLTDRVFIAVLAAGTLLSALTLTVNPWPRDHWFETQYLLYGNFQGQDNYTPITLPALLFKLTGLLAQSLGLDLAGEMYVASLAQNVLMLLAALFVYYACRRLGLRALAQIGALIFLVHVLSTGLPQAFWSENVVLFLFAAALYVNVRIYTDAGGEAARFWWRASASSVLIGLLVITRMTPVFLIPALALLFYGRMSLRRLAGYTGLMVLTTSVLIGVMLASNYARFGRAEITNSSGRHLWQGVTPIVDQALANSAEFQELRRLTPDIEGKDYWSVRLPDDERKEFAGEALFGRLSRQAIRAAPLSYLALGVCDFVVTIGRAPYRLGFGDPVKYNPLHTDKLLPAIAEAIPGIPHFAVKISSRLITLAYDWGRKAYPVIIFFVLTTYCALAVQRARLLPSRRAGEARKPPSRSVALAIHTLAGIAIAALANVGGYRSTESYLPSGLCVLILLLQLKTLAKDTGEHPQSRPALPVDGVVYTFCALMFFGSLWFTWQVEANNPRNVLPYLPFLAVMFGMAVVYWRERFLAGRRSAPSA